MRINVVKNKREDVVYFAGIVKITHPKVNLVSYMISDFKTARLHLL